MDAIVERPQSYLAEVVQLKRIIDKAEATLPNGLIRSDVATEVAFQHYRFPIYAVELGSNRADVPCVAFVGGVHGIERIGSQVVLYFLHTLIERAAWDQSVLELLQRVKLVFVPVLNPVGMFRGNRCNGQNVDLMRNAPVDAEDRASFLVGGHRISPHLPWYRGAKNDPMEPEAQTLVDLVKQRVFKHSFSLVLDCHSGFGAKDRLWLPYAKARKPVQHLAEYFALKQLWDTTYPFHHPYVFEPQSLHYLTHGDLWDYLYDLTVEEEERIFLPLTLEMGSWLWVKKNPKQLFSFFGAFHPVVNHRFKRVLRQHIPLFEFLIRASTNVSKWLPDAGNRDTIRLAAMDHWLNLK